MSNIESMGHFTAVGMRTPLPTGSFVANTCSGNDTVERGDDTHWTWSNPTNRAIEHVYEDITAVSVECLWQGTKIIPPAAGPNRHKLNGDWRGGKGKRPTGAYAGPGKPYIRTPGEARRRIYPPAYRRLIQHWIADPIVQRLIESAHQYGGPIFLRDYDTGRGVDRNGPMSHAWVLATWLNTGLWPV